MNKIYIEQDQSLDFFNYGSKELDQNKGFLILGQVGVGKTFSMKAYENKLLKDKGFKSYSVDAFELASVAESKGTEGLVKFINPYPMFIDDIAREAGIVKHYGNELHPLQYIIFERHRLWKEYKDKLSSEPNNSWYKENGFRYLTHMTSNADINTLSEKYGTYIVDRLLEMCNVVVINGISRRS